MDTAGVATLPQLLALDEIMLEIAIDNHYGQELIQHQKEVIQETKERIKELKREGQDPRRIHPAVYFRSDAMKFYMSEIVSRTAGWRSVSGLPFAVFESCDRPAFG